MSFTYITGIPNPPNDPSVDVPNMQTNTNSIDSWTQVDHVGFNNGAGGKHEQVTFAANNPPSVPTSPPVLFTNIQDGAGNTLPNTVPELFFYSGTAPQGQNQYVSTANGSTVLMGGIILKWGLITGINNGTSYSFPVAFPNNVFSVVLTCGNLGNNPSYFTANSVTVSGIGQIWHGGGTTPSEAYYIAIGN